MDKRENDDKIVITLHGDEVLTDFFDPDDGVMGDEEPDFEKEIVIIRK